MEDVLNGLRRAATLVFWGRLGFLEGLYPLVIGKYQNYHEQLSNTFQDSFVRWNEE